MFIIMLLGRKLLALPLWHFAWFATNIQVGGIPFRWIQALAFSQQVNGTARHLWCFVAKRHSEN
jgi:hypothetical protein